VDHGSRLGAKQGSGGGPRWRDWAPGRSGEGREPSGFGPGGAYQWATVPVGRIAFGAGLNCKRVARGPGEFSPTGGIVSGPEGPSGEWGNPASGEKFNPPRADWGKEIGQTGGAPQGIGPVTPERGGIQGGATRGETGGPGDKATEEGPACPETRASFQPIPGGGVRKEVRARSRGEFGSPGDALKRTPRGKEGPGTAKPGKAAPK